MKLDDLEHLDRTNDSGPIDADIVAALGAFGFVNVSYSLVGSPRGPIPRIRYCGTITGHRMDGTQQAWRGFGATPEEAEQEAIDELAKWVMAQPTPSATP